MGYSASVWTLVLFLVALIALVGMYIFLPFKSVWFGCVVVLALAAILLPRSAESYLFEVSPERRLCMEERVSRNLSGRSCGCCRRGFIGATPLGMQEWVRGPDWIRTDSYTTDPQNAVYRDQVRPSELVGVSEPVDEWSVNRFTGDTL